MTMPKTMLSILLSCLLLQLAPAAQAEPADDGWSFTALFPMI